MLSTGPRRKTLVCKACPILLGAGLLAMACEPKDLARKESSGQAKQSNERDAGPDVVETEVVMPPQNIAGSYLVQCDTYDTPLPSANATRILCALRDTAGKKANEPAITWSIEPNPGTNNLLGQELLPAPSNWHVEFLLRSDYFQQNAVEVVASFGAQGDQVRLGKDHYHSASTGTVLSLVDRTADLNHQAVAAATLGSGNAWSAIYQDPVTLLFVTNPLHGDMPFTNAEATCAQLDSASPLEGTWRLPGRQELTRLHRLRADLIAGFSDWFWSGETLPSDVNQAYYEILYDAQISTTPKTNGAMAFFCVADQVQ